MRALLLILTLIISPLASWSSVNLRNGSYTETWVDFIDPQDGIEMKVERYYSSRSLFIGLFGFGWCSNMETHLTITSDGILNLTECGGGLEVTYYPKDFDLKSPADTINQIVADFQKSKKLRGNDLKNLRAQLTANTKMRFEYANKMGLVNIKKIKTKNNTFLAKTKGFESIDFNGKYYERKKVDGSIERFNLKGQLTQIVNSAGLWLKIQYKGSRIAYMVDQKGRRLNFSYDRNGKLSKIFNGRKLFAEYKFNGENLVEVTNMWKKTYQFIYDNNHNLTQVKFPDSTEIKMSYNISKDWIKTYTNRKNCVEVFQFQLSDDDPKNHYWSNYSQKCPKKDKTEGKHEFWYKNYSFTNDKYLHRAQESYEKHYKDIFFHPYLGRPISVRDDNIYQGFAYYLNGLVNKSEFKKYSESREIIQWHKMSYTYDFNKYQVTKTIKEILNKLGKKTGTEVMSYRYNKNNLIYYAANRRGQSLAIGYDENGKITSLTDGNKAKVRLDYTLGYDKPSTIELMGIGKIEITYDSEGDIKNVENPGKRNVASSVVEKFIEMVRFLGPMGESLSIE